MPFRYSTRPDEDETNARWSSKDDEDEEEEREEDKKLEPACIRRLGA
jgi:hypothetical protein